MTGPEEPGDDWGFPEVDPASTQLPSDPEEDGPYDTGSDAWWRAQAEAQRRAAAAEPVLPPAPPPAAEPPPAPELVEPSVLNTPSPLDEEWVPPELPELRAPDEEPAEESAQEPADDVAAVDGPDWYRGLVDTGTAEASEPMPAEVPPPLEPAGAERPAVEPERVGPARAVAGAALALLGVLLAVGALLVFNGKDEPKGGPTVAFTPNGAGTTSAAPSPTPSPTPTLTPSPPVSATAPPVVATTPAEAPKVPVSVLNNSRISHLADRAAQRFRAGGWTVTQTGNFRGRVPTTTVYYAPGQQASAERFARQFGIPRVAPRFAGIPVQGMTVILTRDYRA